MVQRVRTAAGVLPGNFLKIHFQGLPSFHASKRYSSRTPHGIFILVPERPSPPSLEHPSSSLLRSGSLSLKPPSSSPLDGSLPRDARALVLTALPSLGRVRVASMWSRSASAVVDRVVLPNEGRDDTCRLKPLKRYKCCSIGMIVKVVNRPHVARVRDESSQLGQRDSSPVTTVPDSRRKGGVVCGVRTERDLGALSLRP
jgi:hypothetical protein